MTRNDTNDDIQSPRDDEGVRTGRDVVEDQIDAGGMDIAEFLQVNLSRDTIRVVFHDERPQFNSPQVQVYQRAFADRFFFIEGEEIIDLESCWRCGDEVPRDDDLGLCKPCVQYLQDL